MNRKERTLLSLTGLSVGDAFGEKFFAPVHDEIQKRQLPPATWKWTDDTHMALSVVEILLRDGEIKENQLVARFVERYRQDPARGYGAGAHRLLSEYSAGADWRVEAQAVFEGGSYGNGGAMRAAPIGAYFSGEPERAKDEAQRSAIVTHAHIEGQAGAMAVAAATALVENISGVELIAEVAKLLPAGQTKDGLKQAMTLEKVDIEEAAKVLGSGQQVAAFDTVPFCLWVVAHFQEAYEDALWATVTGLGDRDTTCAIVGGIVALRTGVPKEWIARRELLPEPFREV